MQTNIVATQLIKFYNLCRNKPNGHQQVHERARDIITNNTHQGNVALMRCLSTTKNHTVAAICAATLLNIRVFNPPEPYVSVLCEDGIANLRDLAYMFDVLFSIEDIAEDGTRHAHSLLAKKTLDALSPQKQTEFWAETVSLGLVSRGIFQELADNRLSFALPKAHGYPCWIEQRLREFGLQNEAECSYYNAYLALKTTLRNLGISGPEELGRLAAWIQMIKMQNADLPGRISWLDPTQIIFSADLWLREQPFSNRLTARPFFPKKREELLALLRNNFLRGGAFIYMVRNYHVYSLLGWEREASQEGFLRYDTLTGEFDSLSCEQLPFDGNNKYVYYGFIPL